ncbi:MAG: hypothetical protein OEZ22_08035 [Spirochaetia bacterium]|nr:hypothetical protein [Spirochaetia bacterium]
MRLKIKITAAIAALLFASSLFASVDNNSLRSASTAYLFGDTYDMVTTAPYLLGSTAGEGENAEAKLGGTAIPLSFQNSSTTGKVNVFSNLNNVNDDGSLVLGTAFNLGNMAIGLITEVTNKRSGYNIDGMDITGTVELGTNYAYNGLNVNADSVFESGNGSDNVVNFLDPLKNGNYTRQARVDADGERYRDSFDVNALLAFNMVLGNMAVGLSLERDTTGSYNETGYANETATGTDLEKGIVDETRTIAIEHSDVVSVSNNIALLHAALTGMGPLKLLGIKIGANYQTYSQNVETTRSRDFVVTKATDTLRTDDDKIELEDSGLLILADIRAFMDIASFEFEFGVPFAIGGTAVDSIGTSNYSDSTNNKDLTNSAIVDNTVNERVITSKSEDKDGLKMQVGLDIIARKKVNKDLTVALGIKTFYESTEFILPENTSGMTTVYANDGNGIVDGGDSTTITSYSRTEEGTINSDTLKIQIPVGAEYNITPALTLRAAARHIWYRNLYSDTTNTSGSRTFIDNNADNIAGNEQDTDVYQNTWLNAGNDGLLRTQAYNETRETIYQNNTYFLGLGYSLGGNLQLDMALKAVTEAGTYIDFNAGDIQVNGTLLF